MRELEEGNVGLTVFRTSALVIRDPATFLSSRANGSRAAFIITPHFSFGIPLRATRDGHFEGRYLIIIQHLCFDATGGSALPRQCQDAVIDGRHLHSQSYRVLVFTWSGGIILSG